MRSAGYLNIAAYFDAVPNRELQQAEISYLWRRIGGAPLTLHYMSLNRILMAFLMKDFDVINYRFPFRVDRLSLFAYRKRGKDWKYKVYEDIEAAASLIDKYEEGDDYPFFPVRTENSYMIVPYPGYEILYIGDNGQELFEAPAPSTDRLVYSALYWALLYADDYGYLPKSIEEHIINCLLKRPTTMAGFEPYAYDVAEYDVNMGSYPLMTGARVAYPDKDFNIDTSKPAPGLCFGLEVDDIEVDAEDYRFVMTDGGFIIGGRFLHTGLYDVYVYDISKYEWDDGEGTWIPVGPYEEPIDLKLSVPLSFPHLIFAFEKPYMFSHHYVRIDPAPGDSFEVPFMDPPLPYSLEGAYTPYSGSYHDAMYGNPTVLDEHLLKCVDPDHPERYSYSILDVDLIRIHHCGYRTYIYIFILRHDELQKLNKSVDSVKYDVLDGLTLGVVGIDDDFSDTTIEIKGNPDPLYLSSSYEWLTLKVKKDGVFLDAVVVKAYDDSDSRIVMHHANLAPDYGASDVYPIMTTWFGYALVGVEDSSRIDHFVVEKI